MSTITSRPVTVTTIKLPPPTPPVVVSPTGATPLTAEMLTGILTSDQFIDTMGSRIVARITPRVQPIIQPLVSSLPVAAAAAGTSIGNGFGSIAKGLSDGFSSIFSSARVFGSTLSSSMAQAAVGSQGLTSAISTAPTVPGGTAAIPLVLSTTATGATGAVKGGARRKTMRGRGKKQRSTRRH